MSIIQLDTADGAVEALLLEPSQGRGPFPGVVIIHDVSGFTSDAKKISQRVADAGYLVVTPNLYSRGGRLRCVTRVFRDLLAKDGRAVDDILAAKSLLEARDDCSGKVGVIGFCMGGQFALVVAPKDFDVAAPFYPVPLPRELSDTLNGACPVVASFGGRDPLRRGGNAKTLKRVLDQKGIVNDVKTYPDVGHSFANRFPMQPLLRIAGFAYDEDAAEDAWKRVFAFFDEHLRAQK